MIGNLRKILNESVEVTQLISEHIVTGRWPMEDDQWQMVEGLFAISSFHRPRPMR